MPQSARGARQLVSPSGRDTRRPPLKMTCFTRLGGLTRLGGIVSCFIIWQIDQQFPVFCASLLLRQRSDVTRNGNIRWQYHRSHAPTVTRHTPRSVDGSRGAAHRAELQDPKPWCVLFCVESSARELRQSVHLCFIMIIILESPLLPRS